MGRGQGTELVKVDTIGQGNEGLQSGVPTSYTCGVTVDR